MIFVRTPQIYDFIEKPQITAIKTGPTVIPASKLTQKIK